MFREEPSGSYCRPSNKCHFQPSTKKYATPSPPLSYTLIRQFITVIGKPPLCSNARSPADVIDLPAPRAGPATKHSRADGASPGSEATATSCSRQGVFRRTPISKGKMHRLKSTDSKIRTTSSTENRRSPPRARALARGGGRCSRQRGRQRKDHSCHILMAKKV